MEAASVPVQGTAFATKGNQKKDGAKKAAASGKYLKAPEWNALSSEEQAKIIKACKKAKANEDDDKSTSSSSKSIKLLSKTIKSLEKATESLRSQ